MVGLYVRARVAGWQVLHRLHSEQDGLSMIEYGVMAAFLILCLVGAATIAGPALKQWILDTIEKITSGRGS